MPQMAPISWLTLFLVFSFSFIIFNMLNYYCFNNQTNTDLNSNNETITNNKNNSMNWKW